MQFRYAGCRPPSSTGSSMTEVDASLRPSGNGDPLSQSRCHTNDLSSPSPLSPNSDSTAGQVITASRRLTQNSMMQFNGMVFGCESPNIPSIPTPRCYAISAKTVRPRASSAPKQSSQLLFDQALPGRGSPACTAQPVYLRSVSRHVHINPAPGSD